MEPETTTLASGNGAASQKGFPPIPIRPPDPRRATDAVLGVEIGGPIESDGSLPLRISADVMQTMRATWQAACTLHASELAKVNALNTEASALLRSRAWFFNATQRSLKQADAALAEIRVEQKQVEERIRRATVPLRAKDDLSGQLLAAETRTWLRAASEPDRMSLVEKAIAAGNLALVAAALEQPLLSGLTPERAALLLGRWRRQVCPEELQRLELLQKTAERVMQAGQRLQRRFDEGFDHTRLDALEASSKAAA